MAREVWTAWCAVSQEGCCLTGNHDGDVSRVHQRLTIWQSWSRQNVDGRTPSPLVDLLLG